MKIGFTGTRKGMTDAQYYTFVFLCSNLFHGHTDNEWHDGDCIGADAETHDLVAVMDGLKLHGHPSNLRRQRALNLYDVDYDEYPPLVRNKHIVDAVDLMFATPEGVDEEMRGSGTWATIRYARKQDKPLIIIFPNGMAAFEQVTKDFYLA